MSGYLKYMELFHQTEKIKTALELLLGVELGKSLPFRNNYQQTKSQGASDCIMLTQTLNRYKSKPVCHRERLVGYDLVVV
jgi:hypothetical protein